MKKYFGIAASIAMFISLLITYSCKEQDTNGPVINILGDNPLIVVLNDDQWTDPGAEAEDDNDGVVTVTSTNDVNPNFQATSYSITYKAADNSGNESTAVRDVHVLNSARVYEGQYNGTKKDDQGNVVLNYPSPEIVKSNNTVNNKISFAKFDGHDPNEVYGLVTGTSITIPQQTKTVNSQSTVYQGSGQINGGTTIVIDYSVTVNGNTTDYQLTYIKI
jgi:hypothetical protein